MKMYYTSQEIEKGIVDLPPIPKTTLRNLRLHKKIKFTKVGNKCLYKKEWVEKYLESNIRDVVA